MAPLIFALSIVATCRMNDGLLARDRANLERLEEELAIAQENVIRLIGPMPEAEKLDLLAGDPDRIRLRTFGLCSLSLMEQDASWRTQYLDACKALGRADRALQDEQRRLRREVSEPSTDGF